MEIDSLPEIVITVISQVCAIPENQIAMDSSFDELSISSLDVVTIAFELEEKLGISLPDDNVYALKTVQELIDKLAKLANEVEAS